MTDDATSQTKLILVGDPSAASCDGDSCVIPEHHLQAVVNRRLDEDLV